MENSIFKQLCGKMNYNTYNNIKNISVFSVAGLNLTESLLAPQCPSLSIPLTTAACTITIAGIAMICAHGEIYTKDAVQIRELYQEFIKNYNKLNKVFDLNDPIEIYTMFNYLLYKGYLSKDKRFKFSGEQARDIYTLPGTDVITGQAVCRHIAAMLADILNAYGIESNKLSVYTGDYVIDFRILEEPRYTKEELINWARMHAPEEELYNSITRLIERSANDNINLEFYVEMVPDKNTSRIKSANHAITYAFKDEKSYFLDPTQKRIYRISESDKDQLYDEDGKLKIKLADTSLSSSNKENFSIMKKHLLNNYPSVSSKEEKIMIEETMKLCDGNRDIFENFYTENNELYNDISSKILKLKRNPFLVLKPKI